MSRDHSLDDRRAAIDGRLETTLESAGRECLAPARAAIDACEDRWYGLLVSLSYDSVAAAPEMERYLPAATAIELLRGYTRLRAELLTRTTEERSRSSRRGLTSSLLAGDYLYALAHATLGEVHDPRLGVCIRTLTRVSETAVEAFGSPATDPTGPAPDHRSLVDGTAGALGAGAADIGATLAGVDESRREQFATVGRGFATGRQIQRILDPEHHAGYAAPLDPDAERLRRHAELRLEEASRALRDLTSTADVEFLEDSLARNDLKHWDA